MSTPQEDENSSSVRTVAISTEEGGQEGEGGQIVFRDSVSDSFEDTDEADEAAMDAGKDAGKDPVRSRTNSPLYQTLEPPGESDTELDVSNKDYMPAEYEAVTHRNRNQTQDQTRNETHHWNQNQTQKAPPIYQILEAPNKSTSTAEIYANRLATTHEKNRKSDPHVYQVLQPVERPSQEYTRTTPEAHRKYVTSYPPTAIGSETMKGRSTLSMGYRDYRDESSSTMKSGGQPETKGHRLFKVVLVCLAILFLCVVTAIAIAGLVLALKNKSASGCQCEEEIQQLFEKTMENRKRLDALEEESGEIAENVAEVQSRALENEGGIQRIGTMVNESISKISATLDESIGNLMAIDLTNCSTSIEVNCTVPSDRNECTTEQVDLRRSGGTVLSYTCFSTDNKLEANLITSFNNPRKKIKCHCFRENENEQQPKCGLIVTQCHTHKTQ